eukprot:gnl/TRDRNA2_/TRDRNA2_182448_c0_seq1.p1 gnl/TRDRNA2_/TRDRNA2_182448_c0~~gnl/TRDRNA2_/TRDRNA2_182448_c0_seq1.p1  ORF type:complete len:191 (-),score=26.33 gnl/TRDRNA2_/TRDRNA2_182448_c0_seq1:33-605(-)
MPEVSDTICGLPREYVFIGFVVVSRLVRIGTDPYSILTVCTGATMAVLAHLFLKDVRANRPGAAFPKDDGRRACLEEHICEADFTCPVCLASSEDDEGVALVRASCCGALYHNACIGKWLNISPTCPQCRSGLCRKEDDVAKSACGWTRLVESVGQHVGCGAVLVLVPRGWQQALVWCGAGAGAMQREAI